MPPKAADKKPAASKAPATASKAPEKKDAGKKTAASGDKKKRTKARKETYSSYIYKGQLHRVLFISTTARTPRRVFCLVFSCSHLARHGGERGISCTAPRDFHRLPFPSRIALHC